MVQIEEATDQSPLGLTMTDTEEAEAEEEEEEEEADDDIIFETSAALNTPQPKNHLPSLPPPSGPSSASSPQPSPSSSSAAAAAAASYGFPLKPDLSLTTTTALEHPSSPSMAVVVPPAPEKVDPGDGFSAATAASWNGGGGGGNRRSKLPSLSILRRTRRDGMVKRAALGLRVCGFAFCLVSFSVMAADRYRGWSLDSFDRYKEFRYCLAVTVIGAGYSCLQVFNILMDSNKVLPHNLQYYFNFLMDQILTYLLISASSSAAIRIDDWKSNWGADKFPEMAVAAVGMSFMAFVAFALSSLISGYTLSTLVRF